MDFERKHRFGARRRRPTWAIAALLALGVMACRHASKGESEGTGQGATDDPGKVGPIKVGFIASLTGNFSPLGSEDKKAVELAVEQVNAKGGVLGRSIELIERNDQTQPDQSVLAFNDLKGTDIVAVIGSVFSNSALATEPLAEREKIPYLSLTPAQEQVEPVKPYVFVVPALTTAYADRYLQYMQSQHITKIAVAHDTKGAYSVSGHRATSALASKYGVEIVKDEEFETTTSDFSPIFTHIRASPAQALLFWGTGPPGVTAAKQFATAGMKIPLFMTGSQASKLWLDPVGTAAEGITVSSAIGVVGDHLPDGPQRRVIDQMAVPYRQKYGYAPPQFAQDGYSACLLLFEAIKKAASADRSKIRQELERMTLLTPNGRFRYTPTDHSGLSADFISVNVVRGGQLVPTDWAKEHLVKTIATE
jgi:branched-chain amino acid transport system substrate-binding protein